MPPKEKYTDPELREEIKEEVKAGDKGGAPGQWSARKAQMMAREYKSRGGDYTTPKSTGQDASQKHLSQWTEEEWQTKEGSGNAKQEDGSEKRYLPKKAWEKMTEEEKEETEELKSKGGEEGKQFVENSEVAKDARKSAQKEVNDGNGHGEEKGGEKHGDHDRKDDKKHSKQESEHKQEETKQDNENKADSGEHDNQDPMAGQKRANTDTSSATTAKKQKSNSGASKSSKSKSKSSKEAPAPAGSADRLPKKGQKVSWRSLHGLVQGEVLEVATEEKEVEGKKVKASETDPRIVMKSQDGKVEVRRGETVFFE